MKEGRRLVQIAKSQPRKFWKSLEKCYNKPKTDKNDIKIEDIYEHFNTLLGQDLDDRKVMNNDDNERQTDDYELKLVLPNRKYEKRYLSRKKEKQVVLMISLLKS